MDRRVVNVFIDPLVVEEWLRTTDDCMIYAVDGLPKEAKMVNLAFDFSAGQFCATMEHESFDQVPTGDRIPTRTIRVTRYYT